MARRKKPRIDDADIQSRLEELRNEIDTSKLEGIDLKFANDMLMEYAGVAEMAKSCRVSIEHDGILIETTSGAKDNRTVRQVENPAFGTYYKCLARMGDMAQKISKFVKQASSQIEEEKEEDPFDAFIRGV